jgi:hypothetical protein
MENGVVKIKKGIASISTKQNYQLTEKSILTDNSYKSTEFFEQKKLFF